MIMPKENNSKKIVTGKVVLHFPHLFKVNANTKNSNSIPKYGTTIIVDKNDEDTLNKMYSAIKSAAEEGGFADDSCFKTPLNDGDVLHPGESLYKHCHYLYVSTTLPPRVVDHKVEDIKFRHDEFPSGTYAKASLEFAPYKYNGKCGVSVTLIQIQILSGNKLLEMRPNPEDDFVVEEVDE